MPRSRYVAFLRGIGPAKKAPGEELRRCFGRAGYDGVVPVLVTGNVVFALGPKMQAAKAADIAAMLEAHFGYAIPVILRRADAMAAMFARDPFRRVDPTAETRFVCMLGEGARRPPTLPKPPPGAGFRFVGRMDDNLFLVRDNDAAGTPEMMAFLDRTLGPAITTRNWNTMEKIAARLAAG